MLDLLGKYIQAFGLLATLKGDLVIDADNPMGMAEELYAHLCLKDTLDQEVQGGSGIMGLGPISDFELSSYGYKCQTGDYFLTCEKVGRWKPTTMKCSEVNMVYFVSPKSQRYLFVDVSMKYIKDREFSLKLAFHGTKVKP